MRLSRYIIQRNVTRDPDIFLEWAKITIGKTALRQSPTHQHRHYPVHSSSYI